MAVNKYANVDAPHVDTIDTGSPDLPPIIPNSELQLDADISSFYLAWTDDTLAQNTEALKRHIEVKRLMAGCEHVNLHTTRGDKAGRHQASNVLEYQANRKHEDLEKKARVDQIRQWLETYSNKHTTPMPQWDMEADDSMSIRQGEMIREGRVSKIMTLDKDLDMVFGNHIHYDSYEEWSVNGYGKLWLDKTGSQTKLKGQGTSFFWAQLLMGDKADNIPGLPKLPGVLLNECKPTVAIKSAKATLRNAKATARARTAAKKKIAERKSAPIGPALAHTMLEYATSDIEAFNIVRRAYTAHYGAGEFKLETWRGDIIRTNASNLLLEQGKLLWMLRTPDDSVLDFIKGMHS